MSEIQVSTAKWSITVGSEDFTAVLKQVGGEGMAVLRSQPGFISYTGVRVDAETTMTLFTWDNAENARSGALAWTEWMETSGVAAKIIERHIIGGTIVYSS